MCYRLLLPAAHTLSLSSATRWTWMRTPLPLRHASQTSAARPGWTAYCRWARPGQGPGLAAYCLGCRWAGCLLPRAGCIVVGLHPHACRGTTEWLDPSAAAIVAVAACACLCVCLPAACACACACQLPVACACACACLCLPALAFLSECVCPSVCA